MMKIWWPIFGDPFDSHICHKWMVQANTHDEALMLAKRFFDNQNPQMAPFLVPDPSNWVGPIYKMQEVKFASNIAFVG